jgi:hypothetical protein
MRRRDDDYWQRLRKDRRSNAAAILATIAAIAATMTVISVTIEGGVAESRANPLYWLLMVPMVWWVTGLTSFEPRAVRLWKPALGICCTVSVVIAIMAMRAAGTWTGQTVACAVTLIAAITSLILLRGSLVEHEGPAR